MNTTPAASETRVYPSRAAANRAYRAHRDALIAELGWEAESPANPYLANTVELEQWVDAKRAALGQGERVVRVHITTSFNMERVKVLTVHRWDATGAHIP